MKKIVDLTKKNRFLGALIKMACFIFMNALSFWFEICGWFRSHNITGNTYQKIKKFHNKFDGQRCFIVAMGPSLTIEDLKSLKNEITFGMNSLCKIYKDTEFRPTFYGIQDSLVYNELKTFIHDEYDSRDNVFISDRITRRFKDFNREWNVFPLNYSYNAYNRWFKDIFKVKISNDIYKTVYDGFSITISLLQIAMYMGFKEIYLIGADCNFIRDNLHFVNYENSVDVTLDTAAERNLAGYYAVKSYADNNGIKIYNTTRGGKLEIFERVNLDEIINK